MGVPTILMCSCIRLLGGTYTQSNLFLGERWGGFFLSIYVLSQMGLNLYAQTFALYFCELIGGGNEKLIAGIMITRSTLSTSLVLTLWQRRRTS